MEISLYEVSIINMSSSSLPRVSQWLAFGVNRTLGVLLTFGKKQAQVR